LTNSHHRQRLRIDLEDWEGNKVHAEYDNFKIGSELSKYRLHYVGLYSGNAGQYYNNAFVGDWSFYDVREPKTVPRGLHVKVKLACMYVTKTAKNCSIPCGR